MKNQRLANCFKLSEKITVYVPATQNIIIDGTKKSESINNNGYVHEIAEIMSKLYGGATAFNMVTGYWYSDDRKCLDCEFTTPIYSYCEDAENGIDEIIDWCEKIKLELNQDAIALEINGTMYFI